MTQKTNFINDARAKISNTLNNFDKQGQKFVIRLTLGLVEDRYGKEEANKLIDEFGLEAFGWKKVGEV